MKQQEENNKKTWQTPEIIDLDIDKETAGAKSGDPGEVASSTGAS